MGGTSGESASEPASGAKRVSGASRAGDASRVDGVSEASSQSWASMVNMASMASQTQKHGSEHRKEVKRAQEARLLLWVMPASEASSRS